MNSSFTSGLALSALTLLAGCLVASPDETPAKGREIPAAMKPYADKLLEVAKSYGVYGRVDDQIRWAPWLCEMPKPGMARFSESKDEDTHGKKLYSLFASDRKAYLANLKSSPMGQIIVKESWVPEETQEPKGNPVQSRTLDEKTPKGGRTTDNFNPYIKKDGTWYKASKKAGLFVMMKYDPQTEGTDEGWIYGTVSADLKEVTAVGKIASCMECHVKAKSDRLFGIGEEKIKK